MELNLAPFNVTLMPNDRSIVKNLQPITSTDIFEGTSKKLNDNGLFSTTIFGRVGEERRATTYGYVDLRTKILHPILYKNIEKVNSLLLEIMSGKKFAKWDDKKNVFVESDQVEGDTGYSFFMKHYEKIIFERNDSDRRGLYIDVLDKFRTSANYDFVLVMPAGIRDIEEDKKGNLKQDEVNEYYRNLVGLSKQIDTTFKDNKFNDGTKLLMQRNFNSIYDLLFTYLDGKRGITQDKFSKRNVENGTRSVFGVMDLSIESMDDPESLGMNDAVIGIYQTAKSALPLVQNAFKSELINATFIGESDVRVIDPKTLTTVTRTVDSKMKNRYTTEDGVVEWLNKFEESGIRNKPLMLAGGYFAMIYKDEHGFKIVKTMETVPEGKLDKLTPLTMGEFLYYIIYPHLSKCYGWITRYPYAGLGSTIPNHIYMKTTYKSVKLREYNYNWELDDNSRTYPEWPMADSDYVETIQVHPSRLPGMAADFDGDTASLEITYSDESKEELKNYFDNIDNYFDNGSLVAFGSTDTIGWVLKSMTK